VKVLETAGQIAIHQIAVKGFNKVSKGVEKKLGLLPQFSSIENVIQSARKLSRGKNGVRIGRITGNAENIFYDLARQHSAKIQIGQNGQKYFKFGHTRIDLTGSSEGMPTLRINQNNKLFKIRVNQ